MYIHIGWHISKSLGGFVITLVNLFSTIVIVCMSINPVRMCCSGT